MTLRARLAVLTSVAVAVAILAASVSAWLLLRSTLMDEVDQRLLERVPPLGRVAVILDEFGPDDAGHLGEERVLLQGEPIGLQQVDGQGAIRLSPPPGDVDLDLNADEKQMLAGSDQDVLLWTAVVEGESYRVLSTMVDDRLLRMIHPLAGVEATTARMAWLLVALAGVGVTLAAGLGWLVARAGLRPVDRLAAAAEQVAATRDLAHRIDVSGAARDEVSRLGRSLNAMLAALGGAQAQQRQLVEDAGHELRTPLATLRTDIGLLRRAEQHPERTLATDDRASLLRDLETEATALSELVAELVDLARGEIEPEPLLETDLRALVERAVARTRRVNPQVPVAVTGGGFEAAVRPAMLERAVANLVRNAVQLSDAGQAVEVELAEEDGVAAVRVKDRGPGISEADLPRLFDRFYRGQAARERHGGSGLGLAIVAQAAAQHGGTVSAAHRASGGAAFELRFPVRRDEAATDS